MTCRPCWASRTPRRRDSPHPRHARRGRESATAAGSGRPARRHPFRGGGRFLHGDDRFGGWCGAPSHLASLAPEAILAVQDAPLRARPGMTAFGPVVDGDVVTGPPWQAVGKVGLVCGYTHEEFRGHGPLPAADLPTIAAAVGLDPEAATVYAGSAMDLLSDAVVRMPTTWVAEAHARAGGRTWLYDFAWRSPGMGAGHGVDLPFVFGNPASRYAARLLGATPPEEFEALSDRIRAAWVAFATTGDPGWPRYDLDRRPTKIWDTEPSVVDDPLGRFRPPWPSR